ncbi:MULTISPECIES: hypothetical protein [Streptomyces]|uniref:Uncharacterized protein n=1 Tax=Streptomyces sp. NBC_00093 TaxID=2975649 RepID=A0AAU1ZYX7_9ACTN
MDVGTILSLGHVLGLFISIWVLQSRAGGSPWGGMPLSQLLMSPEWFLTTVGKAIVWEITLAVWLATGQPLSPWGISARSSHGRIVRLPMAEREARARQAERA